MIKQLLITDDELRIYIDMLNNYKLLKNNSYEEIIKELKINFNIDISMDRLENYYTPTLNEIIEDTRLLHKNLGYCVEDGDYN